MRGRGCLHASLRTAQTSPRNTFSCTKGRRLSARNSRNVHAAFDADRGEKVAEIVMRDALHPDLFRRVRHAVFDIRKRASLLRSQVPPPVPLSIRSASAQGLESSAQKRVSPFFVPVSGSPRTCNWRRAKSASAHVTCFASPIRTPLYARKHRSKPGADVSLQKRENDANNRACGQSKSKATPLEASNIAV